MEDSKNISNNYQSNNMSNTYVKKNFTPNNMSNQEPQDQLSMNSRSTSSALDPSKKIIKLLSIGNLDFTLTLSLPRTYFEMNEINFYKIESMSDLSFLEHNKQLWKEITLTSNSKVLKFVQQLNRATKEKFFVSFISLGKLNYSKESKFFMVDILTYVTERNWIFLNYDDTNDNEIQSRICFKLICDGEEKSFELVDKNPNDEDNKKESEHKSEKEKEDISKENKNVNDQRNNNLDNNMNKTNSVGDSSEKIIISKSASNLNNTNNLNNSSSKLGVNNKNRSRSQLVESQNKEKENTKAQPNTQRSNKNSNSKSKDKDNKDQNKDVKEEEVIQNKNQNCDINTNRNINDDQGTDRSKNCDDPCNPNETDAQFDDYDNVLCNIKESLIQNFDYLYLDISFFIDKNTPTSITISHLLSFIRKMKEIYCTKIIIYYTNILSSLETSKDISSFQTILYLTDYYLFDKKDAFLLLNFLHIIQHKDDHMKNDQLNMLQTGFSNKRYYNIELINSQFNYKNNILNNEAYKNYSNDKEGTKKEELWTSRLNSTNTSLYTTGMQNKITVSKLNRKKMFDYFKNEIIFNSYFFNCKKVAVFIDNFSKINIMLATQKNNAQFFEYDTKIYPGINHSNLNMVEEYKGLIEKNYDYLIMIFFSTFIGKFILEKHDNNISRSLYISYVTAVESSKKLLEIFKNNLPIPTDQKFFLVNVSTSQINNHFKKTNLAQKENKFTLDCINKNKSEYKIYNSLFDANLYPFFNSSANRNYLVQKGFINKNGYIMYDDTYRNIYTPEQMNMFNDPINRTSIYKSINKIRVGEDIKNKEVDVVENLLKKRQPINKKLPTLTANFATLGYTRKFDSYRNIFDRENRRASCSVSCGGLVANNSKYSRFRNTTNISANERMKINSGEGSFRNSSQKNSRFNATKKNFYKKN